MRIKTKIYARVLWDLVKDSPLDEVTEVVSRLEFFFDVYTEDKNINVILNHPKVALDNKKKVVSMFFAELKNKKEIASLIGLLISKKSLKYLPGILTGLKKFRDLHFSIARVKVRTATGLNAKQTEDMSNSLKKILGKEIVEFNEMIDKAILGGAIFEVDGKMMDCSFRRKLNILAGNFSKVK